MAPSAEERPDALIARIPAKLVEALREGVYAELRAVAQGIADATETPEHSLYPMRYQEHRERFNAVCALLDAIGWAGTSATSDLQVDLQAHRSVLLAALVGAREDAADAVGDVAAGRQKDPAKCRLITERAQGLRELAAEVEAQVANLGSLPGGDQSQTSG